MLRETVIERDSRAVARTARSALPRPATAIGRAVGRIAQAWRNRRDLRVLAALDDRQLRDIGLCREELEGTLPRDFLGISWKLW